MIKFFRKIRQQLIAKNRFRNYALYAIGEVFLILIAVLLALQLGNVNQKNKTKKEEKKILYDLKEECETNLERLNYVLGRKYEIIRNGKIILENTGPNAKWGLNTNFDSLLVKTIVSGWAFKPKTGVLKNIINSGKLEIIKNDSLRKAIANLEADIITFQNEDEVVKKDLHELFIPLIVKHYPIRNTNQFQSAGLPLNERFLSDISLSKFEAVPDSLLQNKEFENILNVELMWINYSIYHYKNIKSKYDGLLELTMKEL